VAGHASSGCAMAGICKDSMLATNERKVKVKERQVKAANG